MKKKWKLLNNSSSTVLVPVSYPYWKKPYPYRTVPYRTRTVPAPNHNVPAPNRTIPYPYRTVPYKFLVCIRKNNWCWLIIYGFLTTLIGWRYNISPLKSLSLNPLYFDYCLSRVIYLPTSSYQSLNNCFNICLFKHFKFKSDLTSDLEDDARILREFIEKLHSFDLFTLQSRILN